MFTDSYLTSFERDKLEMITPSIKISDKGLFDGDNFEFMDVIIK